LHPCVARNCKTRGKNTITFRCKVEKLVMDHFWFAPRVGTPRIALSKGDM
jgi:hypothetical protein